MAFLDGLARMVGVEVKSVGGRALSSARSWTVPGQPYHDTRGTDVRDVVDGDYLLNPYVFRGVQLIAGQACGRRIVMRHDDPVEGPIARSEDLTQAQRRLLALFTRRSNPWEVAQVFRHRLVAQFILSRKGIFLEVIRQPDGSIWGFILLDPDQVEIVPTESVDPRTGRRIVNPIGAFRVTTTAEHGGWDHLPPYDPKLDPVAHPSAVLWIRQPHPTLMHAGVSPLQAAALSLDLDRYARLYNRKFMQQDGRPGGIVAVKGNLSDPTRERLEARFTAHSNFNHVGRTSVIEADQMTYVDTTNHPRDMQWPETMRQMREDAAIALGTPISMLGDASGRTYDNADAEYATFWESPMGPTLAMLDAQWDLLTPGGYEDDLYLQHRTDDVWVLGRHKREMQDRGAADLQRGAITIDDYREIIGLPRLDVPGTRVLMIPTGTVAIGDGRPGHDNDATEAAENPMIGQPPPAEPAPELEADPYAMPPLTRVRSERISDVRTAALPGRGPVPPPPGVQFKKREGEQRGARAGARTAR